MLLSRAHQRLGRLGQNGINRLFSVTARVSQEAKKDEKSSASDSIMGTKTDMKVPDVKSKVGEKKMQSFFGRSDVPININFPNKRGIEGYDPELPLKDVIEEVPNVVREQTKLLKDELLSTEFTIEKTECLEDLGSVRQDEARIEWKFDTPEALARWRTGCDSDWNEGFSKVQFVPTDTNTALFKGHICTEVIKDGRIQRAGWATIKLEDTKFLNRKKYLGKWRNFSHLLIKCRGDGRSYKVMLHAPMAIDMTWGDSFSYPLHTHGGPYWQYEKIPFSKFFHTVAGRIQDKQYKVNLENVSSLGIVLMDRIDGDFQLELDYIGVYNDRSHLEEFAYETYTLPLWNTHGF
ncbi:unnamed protein product [Cylicocyclus nassatus]|uniref:NADH:ubiquinone oxidoreductase intermediate-associated protein 30 domain-containing protein n=1 Tax=Cylicocyclus nassatus TaxID=53992 RepID=A0AA36GEI9_CYLNA|nr:unnamed protein product [Cylicocyclus nassatus]